MTPQEKTNFEMLRAGPCVTAEYFESYYGLSWPLPDDVKSDYELWASKLKRRNPCPTTGVSRYEFEKFLQYQKLTPKIWLAAALGMQEGSLDSLLARLPELGIRPQRYVVYADLIADPFAIDLPTYLPTLKGQPFENRDSYCRHIHKAIEHSLGLVVEPLYCATSERLEEEPRRLAADFDSITLAPVSIKHQIWLGFQKPISLSPDRCSKLFYVENREALAGYLAASSEPDDLGEYEELVMAQQHV